MSDNHKNITVFGSICEDDQLFQTHIDGFTGFELSDSLDNIWHKYGKIVILCDRAKTIDDFGLFP